MTGRDSVGSRLTIHGAVSNRYFTMAEGGCSTEGALPAEWPQGMAWGPHRMSAGPTSLPWQIDMRVAMRAANGDAVIQHYLGTVPSGAALSGAGADRSWRTAAVFEAPARGGHAWLNGVLAVGVGWKQGGEAHYHHYVLG